MKQDVVLPKHHNLILRGARLCVALFCIFGLSIIYSSFKLFNFGVTTGLLMFAQGVFYIVGSLVVLGVLTSILEGVRAQLETRNQMIRLTENLSKIEHNR